MMYVWTGYALTGFLLAGLLIYGLWESRRARRRLQTLETRTPHL